jgi:hypothetical protein
MEKAAFRTMISRIDFPIKAGAHPKNLQGNKFVKAASRYTTGVTQERNGKPRPRP